METLLAPRDAGRILGVSTGRIQQLDREGRLRSIRDSSGRRLFREADVRDLLRQREQLSAQREQKPKEVALR